MDCGFNAPPPVRYGCAIPRGTIPFFTSHTRFETSRGSTIMQGIRADALVRPLFNHRDCTCSFFNRISWKQKIEEGDTHLFPSIGRRKQSCSARLLALARSRAVNIPRKKLLNERQHLSLTDQSYVLECDCICKVGVIADCIRFELAHNVIVAEYFGYILITASTENGDPAEISCRQRNLRCCFNCNS